LILELRRKADALRKARRLEEILSKPPEYYQAMMHVDVLEEEALEEAELVGEYVRVGGLIPANRLARFRQRLGRGRP